MTRIYHITHHANLPRILAADGLHCCAALQRRKVDYHDIANEGIQARRATTPVPCEPGGVIHDYVPFYFAPRSPMLFKINKNGPRYPECQRPVIHLVSTAEAVYAAELAAVFTNGHAIMDFSDFFTDPSDFDKIDWEVMAARYWRDTQQDPNRCCRRQAEFLVHKYFPWQLVTEIAVENRAVFQRVREALAGIDHAPEVRICPEWYY